jgi:hypothetical protein
VTEHLTQPTGSHGLSGGNVLGVESAVLEDRQGHASRSRRIHDTERPRGIRGQRLVHHQGDPRVDALPGLTGVEAARSCEHDEIQTRHPEQGIKISNHCGVREIAMNLLGTLRI